MTSARTLRMSAVFALGILLCGAGRTHAAVDAFLQGTHFRGIFQSSRDMSDVGFFNVLIDSVKNRSFTCRLVLMGTPPDPCKGTLSAAGVFEVIARGGAFQVHGKLDSNGIARAHYRMGADEGSLLMLQQGNNQAPDPEAFGMFDGSFMSDVTMTEGMLSFDISRDTKIGDAFLRITEETMDGYGMPMETTLSFDIFISSAPPDPCIGDQVCVHPFSMIGLSSMGDPGVFVVDGSVDPGGAMGEFLYFPMGIVGPDFVDMGTFDVSRFIGDVTHGQ